MNGDSHRNSARNQLAGFRPKKLQEENSIRLGFWGDVGKLWGQFGKADAELKGKALEEGEWTWMALVSGGETIKLYHEGKIKNLVPGDKFNKETPIEVVVIGANSYGERD